MNLSLKSFLTSAAVVAVLAASTVQAQTNFYWNGGNPSASPAGGGTGTWNTIDAWRTVTDTGTQGTWAAGTGGTNVGFLAGTSGTVTLGSGANFTGTSLTVETAGYTVRSTNGSRNLVMTGALTLGSNVAFTANLDNTGGTWGFGSMTGGAGSSLTLSGAANATANNANRINLTTASGTSNIPSITLSGGAAGPTGFVASASGHTLSSNIVNNSATSATMLGATSGHSLTYSGVLSGSAHLQISAGQSGGDGIVTLSNVNTFLGDTYTNAATNAVLRIGINNALPSTTNVFMGQSAGGGTAGTGGSIDLNGFNLSVASVTAGSSTRGIGNNTSTLSTLTIGKASGTDTFGGVIGTVANTNMTTQSNFIALVKTGASSQILDGTNTYTGPTTISDGTLALGASGSLASPLISVASSASFDVTAKTGFSLGLGQRLGGLGTILGSLEFGTGSELAFNPSGAMLIGSGTLSFASGFSPSNLFGLSSSTPEATYPLFSQAGGSINVAGLANFGSGNPFDLTSGKTAYFTGDSNSLSVVVVPEPSTLGLAGVGVALAGLGAWKRRRTAAAVLAG